MTNSENAPAQAGFVVTTTYRATAEGRARAAAVADICRVPLWERRSWSAMKAESGTDLFYIVSREGHELRCGNVRYAVGPGLIKLKMKDGLRQPLTRAVAPLDGQRVSSVLDLTAGGLGDALHLACVLEVNVEAVEGSPLMFCLARDGRERMASSRRKWAAGARRILLRHAEASAHLAATADDSVDVVYLDPMFAKPVGAVPGFDLVRPFLDHRPATSELLAEAVRVARRRVVMKIPGASGVPDVTPPPPGWNGRVRSQAVDYLVCELELDQPQWDEPDVGTG